MLFSKLCTENHLYHAWRQVKAKNSAGGIDGFSVLDFDNNLQKNLCLLKEELAGKTWNPEPYLRIEIEKNKTEKRKLGLLTIKDKIVQQAILNLVEENFERLFLNNSYAYRKGKGHLKAVRRTVSELQANKNGNIIKLDIDDYFDTINHEILFSRIRSIINDDEIIRLIELSIKMGIVTKDLKWNEIKQGVPQGAILSPVLANFYLHPFDQFVTSRTKSYIRYADDFIIITKTEEEANNIVEAVSAFLNQRLMLKLNPPVVSAIGSGVNFLGVTVYPDKIIITEEKKKKLLDRINNIELQNGKFTAKSLESLNGIKRYYAQLLPQEVLCPLDNALKTKILTLISDNITDIPNKKILAESLKIIPFFTTETELAKKDFILQCLTAYSERKNTISSQSKSDANTKLIRKRKLEYQKREGENSELIISTFGCFIGKSNKGITVKQNGKNLFRQPTSALEHISVLSRGVSISSDAIYYCMNNKIPVDFFDHTGKLYASIISPVTIEQSLWQKQSEMPLSKKCYLAKQIINGKIRNQINLVKYFHKYHKQEPDLVEKHKEVETTTDSLLEKIKRLDNETVNYAEILMGYEAQAANMYWAYVRQLLIDDGVDFEGRIRKGAGDLFNSLLNYGYSLIYPRVWQALLGQHLNPTMGILHTYQAHKPTLAFDLIELFRTQTVDRVVISMLQKGETLELDKSWLADSSKKLLTQNIFERLNRYELYRGNNIKFTKIIIEQARELALYIRGENKSFKPYIAKW